MFALLFLTEDFLEPWSSSQSSCILLDFSYRCTMYRAKWSSSSHHSHLFTMIRPGPWTSRCVCVVSPWLWCVWHVQGVSSLCMCLDMCEGRFYWLCSRKLWCCSLSFKDKLKEGHKQTRCNKASPLHQLNILLGCLVESQTGGRFIRVSSSGATVQASRWASVGWLHWLDGLHR